MEKYESTQSGKEPFSAEIYLRNATGPLGPYFRGMVPDVNGLAVLDPSRLKSAWRDDVDRITNHYGFTQEQRAQAQKALDQSLQWAEYWFDNPDNAEKRAKYYHDLRRSRQPNVTHNRYHSRRNERGRRGEAWTPIADR